MLTTLYYIFFGGLGINYFYEHLKPFAAPMNQYHIIFLLHIYSYKRAFIKKKFAV
jgi:hypothetical protein